METAEVLGTEAGLDDGLSALRRLQLQYEDCWCEHGFPDAAGTVWCLAPGSDLALPEVRWAFFCFGLLGKGRARKVQDALGWVLPAQVFYQCSWESHANSGSVSSTHECVAVLAGALQPFDLAVTKCAVEQEFTRAGAVLSLTVQVPPDGDAALESWVRSKVAFVQAVPEKQRSGCDQMLDLLRKQRGEVVSMCADADIGGDEDEVGFRVDGSSFFWARY